MKVYDPYSNTFYDNSEKLQTVASDRTVSLNAVIATIYNSSGNFKNDLDQGFFADKIRALTPVTSQPKTGHWKRISMDKYSEHSKYWYRCDRCGNDNLGNTDWCPNCGADMREDGEQT